MAGRIDQPVGGNGDRLGSMLSAFLTNTFGRPRRTCRVSTQDSAESFNHPGIT